MVFDDRITATRSDPNNFYLIGVKLMHTCYMIVCLLLSVCAHLFVSKAAIKNYKLRIAKSSIRQSLVCLFIGV